MCCDDEAATRELTLELADIRTHGGQVRDNRVIGGCVGERDVTSQPQQLFNRAAALTAGDAAAATDGRTTGGKRIDLHRIMWRELLDELVVLINECPPAGKCHQKYCETRTYALLLVVFVRCMRVVAATLAIDA